MASDAASEQTSQSLEEQQPGVPHASVPPVPPPSTGSLADSAKRRKRSRWE